MEIKLPLFLILVMDLDELLLGSGAPNSFYKRMCSDGKKSDCIFEYCIPRYHLDRRLDGPRASLDTVGKRKCNIYS
jgi:hypothetical protein